MNPVLHTDGLWLRPIADSEDFDYLFTLMEKYKYSIKDFKQRSIDATFKFAKHIWIGFANFGDSVVKGGVIYLQYFPHLNKWSLDAYKDIDAMRGSDPEKDFSFLAGRLVVKWFRLNYPGQSLWTAHDRRNRKATNVCKRLGFIETEVLGTEFGSYVIMILERETV